MEGCGGEVERLLMEGGGGDGGLWFYLIVFLINRSMNCGSLTVKRGKDG